MCPMFYSYRVNDDRHAQGHCSNTTRTLDMRLHHCTYIHRCAVFRREDGRSYRQKLNPTSHRTSNIMYAVKKKIETICNFRFIIGFFFLEKQSDNIIKKKKRTNCNFFLTPRMSPVKQKSYDPPRQSSYVCCNNMFYCRRFFFSARRLDSLRVLR